MLRLLKQFIVASLVLLPPFAFSDSNFSDVKNATAKPTLPDYATAYFSHETPYIPPQCYTNPVANNGVIANPCYACHTLGKRPNVLNDNVTQLNFTFLSAALHNPWSNMFVDRRAQIAAIKDADILTYVQQDNYRDAQGKVKLQQRIKADLIAFDVNKNNRWDGYIPDAYFDFDNEGFDKNPEGNYTGWRSFAYYPFPGTFMPTNGSTDDVLIRLPRAFQTDEKGAWSKQTYKINLAIVEAMIKEKNIPIAAVDENLFGVDLNKDGELNTASEIVYDWAPLEQRYMSYVGTAKIELAQKKIHIAAKLFPEGTEFLHTVRYLDVLPDGEVAMAKRMKELRYARKKYWATYFDHQVIAGQEIKERHDFPDRPKTIVGTAEEGITLAQGWTYQGFIEDGKGDLRPQTFEEHAFCAGCHSGAGSLVDTTFGFYRKFDTDQFQQGWYHWSQKSLAGIAEPLRESDGEYEYSYYLSHNHTGDEYASNEEVLHKFYTPDGQPKPEAFARLHTDISHLLMPSAKRALALNKAYKLVVEEQSFNRGREAVLAPMKNLHRHVEQDQETGIIESLSYF